MFAISIVIINQSNNPVYAQVQSSNFMRITDDFYRNKGNWADVTDDRCAMLPPWKYALVFPDNGEVLADKPQLWCLTVLETKSTYKIK